MARLGLCVVLLCAWAGVAPGQQSPLQPHLSVQGEPYFDGSMTLSLSDPPSVGQVPLVA